MKGWTPKDSFAPPDDDVNLGQQGFVRLCHDDGHGSPGEHEHEDGEFPEPRGQEDPVLTAQDGAQVPEDVGVSGGLQADAQARQHEEDVGQDVDL